jgi:HD-like signal output (HDOD) protein/signal transduction histidine kinase
MNSQPPVFERLTTLKHLPSLPHLIIKLIEACGKKDPDLTQIAGVIKQDPALSNKILTLVNSAYMALPRKADNIDQAVSLLGTRSIKNLAICTSVQHVFAKAKSDDVFNLKEFWRHSLTCSFLAKGIAQVSGYGNPDEAFLVGLLHDIGKLILWVNFQNKYRAALTQFSDDPVALIEQEKKIAASHFEIGAWLAGNWSLNSFVGDAILYHHESAERIQSASALVRILYVANQCAKGASIADGFDHAQHLLGIGQEQLNQCKSDVAGKIEDLARSLELDIQSPDDKQLVRIEGQGRVENELAAEVKNASLIVGALQSLIEARSEEAILTIVRRELAFLFELGEVLFFLYDAEKNAIVGTAIADDLKSATIADLVLPMQATDSLLIAPLIRQKPLISFSFPAKLRPVLLDTQIMRLLGRQGLIGLPMIANKEPVGVIVVGIDRLAFVSLAKQFKLLQFLADQAATALFVERSKQAMMHKVQAERMAASAAMARKVIHEINNPLWIMKNFLKILGRRLEEEKIAQDEIGIMNEEIDRIGQLLKVLSSFSQEPAPVFRKIDINQIISNLVKIMKEAAASEMGIVFHTDLASKLSKIHTDKDALKQILINLIKNAGDAMQKGGNIYLRTRQISSQLGRSPDNACQSAKGYVEIVIRDDGPGIADEIKERMFDPFVSTKQGHSGLGLSIVHHLMQRLKGAIRCESGPSKGTTFFLELPVDERS